MRPDIDCDTSAAVTPPPDVACYVTQGGLDRFRAEQSRLRRDERPRVLDIVAWAAGNGDRSENGDYLYGKRRLREIDRRLHFLERRIRQAIVVDAARPADPDRVLFGATVTFLDAAHNERRVTIVGVDEADLARGEVSLLSPVARALLGRRVGDQVRVRTPRGDDTVEIGDIAYGQARDAESGA